MNNFDIAGNIDFGLQTMYDNINKNINKNTKEKEKNKEEDKKNIHKIIKMNIIKNSILLGWSVEKKNNDKFVLRKKICNLQNNEKTTDTLLDTLLNIQTFDKFDKSINKYWSC